MSVPPDDPGTRRTERLAVRTRGRTPMRRLWSLIVMDRRQVVLAVVFQTFQVLTFLPFTAGLKVLIDGIIKNDALEEQQKGWGIAAYLAANLVLWPIHAFFTVRAFAYAQLIVRAAVARMRRLTVDQLQRLSISFYTLRGVGALANQVTVDLSRVESFLSLVVNGAYVNLVLGTVTLAVMFAFNVKLALVALVAVPLQVMVITLSSKRLYGMQQRVQRSGEAFAARMSEFISGMRLSRSLGNEEREAQRLGASIEEMRAAGFEASVLARWIGMWLQMTVQFMPVLVWCVGGWLFLRGDATLGDVVAFVGLVTFVQWGMTSFHGAWEQWLTAKPGLESVLAILDSQDREDHVEERCTVRLEGRIELHGVAFAYPGNERTALEDIEVVVPAGQRVGLVGETGAGKSTFLDLVLAFHKPDRGEITWDGHPLFEIGRRQLRRSTAIMAQESFIWNATVRENIRCGRPEASDAEVEEAARRAQAHEFIARLEQGYETPCGERGGRLSGGQKQRIALARLFLRDPRIVVLDEPTSALDLETEARLQKDLDEFCRGRTTFVVAHRLSTLKNVDRILVFCQGRIVEDGPPDELLGRKVGHFARLHALQWHATAGHESTGKDDSGTRFSSGAGGPECPPDAPDARSAHRE